MTETTPLLGPLVPRISEEQPGDDDDIKSNTTMFWEEMRTSQSTRCQYLVRIFHDTFTK